MKTLSFTIIGNHKDAKGNPVPKLKMTGKQHWTPKAKEYVKWKAYVVSSFFGSPDAARLRFSASLVGCGKPITLEPKEHAFMSLNISWAGGVHGDPENIFGSIADALFHNDKNLDVRTMSWMSPTKSGRVSATIYLFEDESEKVLFIGDRI